jgi:antitoxin component of MazEF toxin-antitoxin module
MRARIIKIGNSQGIRIPKPLLEQTGIEGEANLEVENHQIIIRPVGRRGTDGPRPLSGWRNTAMTG